MNGESASVRERVSNEEDIVAVPRDKAALAEELEDRHHHERTVAILRVFWAQRKFMLRVGVYALSVSALIAMLIPTRYESVTRLMPPDGLSGSGIGLLSAMAGRAGVGTGGLGALQAICWE